MTITRRPLLAMLAALAEANVKIRFETLMEHLEPLLENQQDNTIDNSDSTQSTDTNKNVPPPFSDN